MTDNEIIKALECCIANDNKCPDCPIFGSEICGKPALFFKEIFDLINRQQAEIEKLKEASEEAVSCFHRMESLYNIKCMELKVAKAEAVKEFVERLKEELEGEYIKATNKLENAQNIVVSTNIKIVDNLVKEMVGEG